MTPADNELTMLWVILTANRTYSPSTAGNTAATIFTGITGDVQAAVGNPAWNWPNLTAATAQTLITAAVNKEDAANGAGVVGPYSQVISTVPVGAWQGGPIHPSAAQLVAALNIT
jgi:hypothetical protein